jgi:uncharacterized protein YsxB (DUF464 family)
MKPLTPGMASALKHLVETIDLNAEQVKNEDWTDAVCTAREELLEGTMTALEQLGSTSEDAQALAKNCAGILYLAINSVERNFTDEALLHLRKLSTNLDKLKAMLETSGKEI